MRYARVLSLCLSAAVSAPAQTEAALKTYFEGKMVVVLLDVPGGKDGLDLYPKAAAKLDLKRYSTHLRQFGPALIKGDSATISAVRVNEKSIEFQLAGRAYGILSDDTSSPPFSTTIPKSPQPQPRHTLGNALLTLWYPDKSLKATIPVPEELQSILSEYIDFGTGSRGPRPPVSSSPFGPAAKLRKGMTQSQVLDLLGAPRRSSEHMESGVKVVTNTFQSAQGPIEVDFVKNVVVDYRIISR